MKTKLTALAFLLLPTISTPTFAGFTLTADGFTNNGDGTVTDDNTGLIWQACTVGQTFNNSTGGCDGKAETYQYEEAMKLTSDFRGQTDWRVPTISELNSIVDFKTTYPSINKSLFPSTSATSFWSSSVYTNGSNAAWIVDFSNGKDDGDMKYNNYAVRLVRGEPSSYSDTLKLADFVDNKDGTVTHKKTGLTWQRCAVGQKWNSGNCEGNATSYDGAKITSLTSDFAGKTDWRLPSVSELKTIVDYSASDPATNLTIFPDAPSDKFWIATPYVYGDYYWMINFSNGANSIYPSHHDAFARLVRGTLIYNRVTSTPSTPTNTGGADLTSSITTNQSSIPLNQNITYTASISNKGTGTANSVSVLFMMPPRWTNYVSLPSDCKTNGAVTTCSIGSVNAGANVSRSMTVNFSRRGGTSVGALVKSNDDTNDSNNMSRIVTTITK
jgi:uncharacterized repeat protein (TIGR01451 family)